MKEFKVISQQSKLKCEKALKQHSKVLKIKYFKAIWDFSKMTNKKLESKMKIQ